MAADLSTWTVEQLRQALNDKETKTQVALDNAPLTNILPPSGAVVAPGVCIFKPTRQGLLPCSESATVFYGSKGYCQKHRRTVQSIRDKKEYEESIAASIQPEEPVVPVPNPSEPKVEEVKKVEKVIPLPEVPTKIKKRIQRNKWGRFEDPDTHIVFNPTSKTAYGVQDTSSGKLLPLSKGDVELCKKYGWPYETIESDDEVSDEVEADEAASDEVENEAASEASDEVTEAESEVASDDEASDVANSSDDEADEADEADDEGSEDNEADDEDEADDDADDEGEGNEADDEAVSEEMCDECGNIVEECVCDVD